MRIDFISDISCAWCAIGLRGLDLALEQLGSPRSVDVHIQPFELNPDMGPEGENFDEYLLRKYGRGAVEREATHALLQQHGAAFGLTMRRRSRIWNTFDAHRLIHWAEGKGAGRQLALERGLLHAHHAEGLDPSSHAVLIDVASRAGLDPAQARTVLVERLFAQEVRAVEARWHRLGVYAVPTMIVNSVHVMQGAQSPRRLLDALRAIAAEPPAAAVSMRKRASD